MKPIDLAQEFLRIFYSREGIERLSEILDDQLHFKGPLFESIGAKAYLDALISDPPTGMSYSIQNTYQNGDKACIIYTFRKGDISIPMVQEFQIKNDKISRILLVFDSKDFL
jgi:hypothetical protein